MARSTVTMVSGDRRPVKNVVNIAFVNGAIDILFDHLAPPFLPCVFAQKFRVISRIKVGGFAIATHCGSPVSVVIGMRSVGVA